tara:strand:- start:253 stop:1605 length:1353 start_codon:yes stop_codon:yes gene_type:complete
MRKSSIKQDMNFLEHPMWLLDQRTLSDGNTWRDRDGFVYYAAYKVPTQVDMLFLLSLLQTCQEEGWATEIEISRHSILKACGKSASKGNYDRLMESLKRWEHVRLEFAGTFYNGIKYISMHFGIIDEWRLTDTKMLTVRFSPTWLTHIRNSTFYKYIDLGSVKRFKSPLAMRLYEILMKSFQASKQWTIDAKELADKIPMKQKHVSHITPKIRTAVKQIREKTDLNVTVRISKKERGKATLTFFCHHMNEEEFVETPEPLEETMEQLSLLPTPEEIKTPPLPAIGDALLLELLALVREDAREHKDVREKIQQASRYHEQERLRRNILYANSKSKENYAAFLMKAIQGDWAEHLHSSEPEIIPPSRKETQQEAEKKKKYNDKEFLAFARQAIGSMGSRALRRLTKKSESAKQMPEELLASEMMQWYEENFFELEGVISRLYVDYRVTIDVA